MSLSYSDTNFTCWFAKNYEVLRATFLIMAEQEPLLHDNEEAFNDFVKHQYNNDAQFKGGI
jgi:hypothetical protein